MRRTPCAPLSPPSANSRHKHAHTLYSAHALRGLLCARVYYHTSLETDCVLA